MCMSYEYMFPMMVITGPSNSKCLIDTYLEPLIEELQILWHIGVLMRDSAKDETFTMRTALMWIVNVLPTYGMASGWSTAGVVRCPVNKEKHLLEARVLVDAYDTAQFDVMHIEKNVFDNIFNTVMDIKEKTKDNLKARKDLNIICTRPELEVDKRRLNVKPKAVYTLTREHKRRICK
ncbi:hypothetical protein Sango_2817600 [Sesamum angolense]|uniref:Uncharacterized protein n=1 Tax=Sesamum angolense TaxID=2727404 RepID=A0AAE1T893_9LAMI|nr:hypothetical protein Sango_2817600 [Sesamum angolense]